MKASYKEAKPTRKNALGFYMPPLPCPTNGQPGHAIDTLTLKALLARPLTALTAERYLFCHAPDCATVYYSADGQQCFTEADLRECVYQKHPSQADVPLCYCFGHTVGQALIDPARVLADIEAGVRAGQCACDIRNPQGKCCLGNVRALLRHA